MVDKIEIFYNQFILKDGYKLVLEGLGVTILLSICALFIGLIVGTLVAILMTKKDNSLSHKILVCLAKCYVGFFRGTPIVVQLLFIYFVVLPLLGLGGGSALLVAVFIFGLNLGVKGAAIATVVSQIISAVFVLLFLTGKKPELKLQRLKDVEFRFDEVGDVLSLGSSSFVMQCTNSLVQIACNSMLSQFGSDLYVSCMTVINSVRQILEVPVLAIGDGSSPILSYNYGAKNYKGVKKAIRIITCAGVFYTLVAWLFVFLFPSFFIHIFNDDSKLLQIAIPAIHMYFFAFVFQAFQYCGQTVFKSLNKKKQAIFFSLLRKVVIVVPLTFFLPYLGFGTMGVFMAEPISNFIGGSICFITMLVTVYFRLD